MKSYDNIWDDFISNRNIKSGIVNASRGKRDRPLFHRMFHNQTKWCPIVRHWIINYHNAPHKPKEIYDGIARKKRTIIVPTVREQIVHHMIVNKLKPIFMEGMYEHSYGSIPKRGGFKGAKVIKRFIKYPPDQCTYCLKMDIHHFFDTVDHDVLKAKLARKIRDKRFLKLLYEILDVNDIGLPLGFYPSQWFANWLLQDLDHYIKETLQAEFYIRYMDDMVVFGADKKKLHTMRILIDEYLETELHLKLKDNWQIFQFDYLLGIVNGEEIHGGRFLDFMGYRFYCNKTTLRKGILLKLSRKAKKIARKLKMSEYDARQMLSYLGWLKPTDTYDMYKNEVKPFISFKECKMKISIKQKRRNKNEAIN